MKKYSNEVKERWGQTDEYKEHEEKTKNYSSNKWDNIQIEMNEIFKEFALCMIEELNPSNEKVLQIVSKLHNYINNNFYKCSCQ